MIQAPGRWRSAGEWEDIMKTRYTVALSMIAGAALGGAAIPGLHAQAKPLAYVITEVEILDQAAFNEFSPKVPATMQPFGGKYLVRGGKVISLEGDAPKRVVVSVYDNVEKAQAWRDSAAWKELMPVRSKAVKTRAYIVEGVTQ
jgi:uncharacterized protein (DUF1330 family)